MALNSTAYKSQYTANGATTNFAFPYRFLLESDLVVTVTNTTTGVDTVQTLTTHYTVDGEGDASGGSITFLSAPANGRRVTIERVVPLTQLIDYQQSDAFPADTHEEALDKLAMCVQQLGATGAEVDRSIKFPSSEAAGFTSELPSAVNRADKVLAFDGSGVLSLEDATTLFASQIADIDADVAAAAASASSASSSASTATTQATNASNSASAASTSATNAADSAAAAAASAASFDQYDKNQFATASGTDTYTVGLSTALTAYASGQQFAIKFTNANTGAATLNIDSLGAKTIQKNGAALVAGDIPANSVIHLVYDGTNLQMIGSASSGGSGTGNFLQVQIFS